MGLGQAREWYNKTKYTATPVAYGWVGVIFEAKDRKHPKKVKCDQRITKQMDGRTNGPTDRQSGV